MLITKAFIICSKQTLGGWVGFIVFEILVNSKAVSIMANPNRKTPFWSNGSHYAGYREYTIDELLEALEIILFNTYIQFNGCILLTNTWSTNGW